jgi:hypothetical protein
VARVITSIGPPTFEGKTINVDPTDIDPRRPNKQRARAFTPVQLIEDRRSRLLFQRYQEGRLDDAEVVHLLGFLGLYDHTPPKELKREFKRISEAAAEVQDEVFIAFMDAVSEKFRNYLNRSDPSHKKEK